MASVKCQAMQEMIVKAIFRRDLTLVPTTYYLGLAQGVLPAKTAALSSLTEVTGPGYARVALPADATGFPTIAVAGTDWKVSSLLARYQASGGLWTPADFAFLCNVASGTAGLLYGAVTLASFQHQDGDIYDALFEYQDRGAF